MPRKENPYYIKRVSVPKKLASGNIKKFYFYARAKNIRKGGKIQSKLIKWLGTYDKLSEKDRGLYESRRRKGTK